MVIERVYNIPLRKGFRQVARYKKTKKAGAVLKEFLSRHMKQPDLSKVLIGTHLNIELWKHGIKNPPSQVKVTVIKEDNGDVKAELYGFTYGHQKKVEKEAETETKSDSKLAEKLKEAKKKNSTAETHEHTHEHDHPEHEHNHEEKHEHTAGQTHEHAKPVVKKVAVKKTVKKAE
jgi:ribosomal protein L31E